MYKLIVGGFRYETQVIAYEDDSVFSEYRRLVFKARCRVNEPFLAVEKDGKVIVSSGKRPPWIALPHLALVTPNP